MKYQAKSRAETEEIAKHFIQNCTPKADAATLIGLYGDLGSGKTTFTQAVAKTLGVEEHVTSPTFIIEKIYRLKDRSFEHLIHIDAYRLESGDELLKLGWKDIMSNPKNIIFLEWPEKVASILPENIKKLEFTFIDETTREIIIN